MKQRGPRVMHLGANLRGRDFVMGDIHGAYDTVWAAMKAVGFDKTIDRIFVAGDLIDRGIGSHRVKDFLLQDYTYAVAGNHDYDFSTVEPHVIRHLAQSNYDGMGWAAHLSDAEILSIQDVLLQLPIAMDVETPRGLVGFVHADIPLNYSWERFLLDLAIGDEAVIEVAIRGRLRFRKRDSSGVAGIGRVFVGHNVSWNGVIGLGNVYSIDTGAVFSELPSKVPRGHLTMTDVCAKTSSLTSPPPTSFGAYRFNVIEETSESEFQPLRLVSM